MHFNPSLIAAAPLAIKIHMATVIPAFFLGSWLIFLSAKGARVHRSMGALYLVLMTVTALTTLFIHEIDPGHFSWIHLLIPVTLFGVVSGLWNIRRRNIRGHQRAMLILYFGALVIAGGFTFTPGRLMHRVFFG
jgi:uncharacterized membrane protein